MNEAFIFDITHKSLKIAALVGAPMLIGSLVVGLSVSLFQAVTQINEQTLTFIPKIVVMASALVIFGPWILDTLVTFTRELYLMIPEIVASGK